MSNVATTFWQAGLQAAIGTPVAATRKIYEAGPIPAEKRVKELILQSRTSFAKNYDAAETHVQVDKFQIKGVLNYSDLAWWGETFLKGGVTPTGAGPYTRVYNGMATSDDLKPVTFEVADNVGAFRISDGLVSKWKIQGKGGSKPTLVEMSLDWLASRVTPGHTMTPALTDRDLRGTYAAFKQVQFYLDDAAGGIGTTEIGTLMEFSIEGDNGQAPLYFGGDAGHYGAARRGERDVVFMVTLLFDATTYSEFSGKYQVNANRFGQLKFTGPSPLALTWNFCTKFETYEWPEDGPTRKVSLMGHSIYDPTLGYDWQATLINDVAAI
ncbi:MAG: hypothetical protein KJ063_02195 [Anaerolineae bacterium]|nr:hypothetical protein [Anaerolineae bacterium]